MGGRGYLVLSLLALTSWAALCNGGPSSASLVNKKIERVIDITSQVVKVVTKIQVNNVGSSPVSDYVYAVDPEWKGHLSYIGASIPGAGKGDKGTGLTVTKETTGQEESWKISFGPENTLKPGMTQTIEVKTSFTHLLSPHPSEIGQNDKQLVILNGNHYFLSPYLTESQTTKVKIPSGSSIESYSKLKPSAQSGSTIDYGPYDNIAANSRNKLTIHYENNNPFLVVTRLERTLEVSHWAGIVSIEEDIDVRHDGAILKGSFSRYDYQRDTGSGSSSIKSFKTKLPVNAFDVYYRDEIGNISTSHMRQSTNNVLLDLRPRFPLFGGWKTHYILGYSVPAADVLFNDGNHYILRLPFVGHIFDNVVVEDVTVKVALPEGASDIKLRLPYSITRDKDEVKKTYLDTFGRTVVVLRKSNLVDEHIQDIEVHYTFNRVLMLQEPLLLVAFLFLLCLVVVVSSKLDFALSSNPLKDVSVKVSGTISTILKHHENRESIYESHDQAMTRFKSGKDGNTFQATLKKLNADYKQETQAISDLIPRLKSDGASPDLLEKVNELQRLDKSLKDQLQQEVQVTERLVNGKVSKQSYLELDRKFVAGKTDIVKKMHSITFYLNDLLDAY